jgi:hypothetical protein
MGAAWANFFIAEVGASAALLGLLFVSISLNLSKILASDILPGRTLLAMLLLLGVLVVSSLLLIPGQPRWAAAGEVFLVGAPIWAIATRIETGELGRRNTFIPVSVKVVKLLVLEVATLSYVVAGGLLALGAAGGLHWLAAGVILSIIRATFDAWVLLVEINR